MRNRELKANEAQLGKDVVDAHGNRVRLEEYLLRPDSKSFKLLFLSKRADRFDWGHLVENFHATIPDDLSQVPAIVSGGILAATKPTNWLTSLEFYATNTVDAEKEVMTLADPVQIDFSGYGRGTLWYPGSIQFDQYLYGPGVPNGGRIQFEQYQDYNTTNAGKLTWYTKVQDTANADHLTQIFTGVVDPTLASGAGSHLSPIQAFPAGVPAYNAVKTSYSNPSGPGKADYLASTSYQDGSSVSVEKYLVSNDGSILDLKDPATADLFNQYGSYNLEINIKSSLFQGRDIDVLIAPEILQSKKTITTTADNLQ
jgi:hypothetical protein